MDQENTTAQHNHGDDLEGFTQAFDDDRAFSNISLGIGFCIIFVNVITMYYLRKYRRKINATGFWQQLVFLCSTDILTGLAVALPPLGYLFFHIHDRIYYSLCVLGIHLFPLSVTLSSGNCCMICMFRYVILKHIDKPNSSWKKYATPLLSFGNVLLCLLTVISSMLVVSILYGFHYTEFCDNINKSEQNDYRTTYMMGSLIIFILFLFGTNLCTILSLVRIRRMNRVLPSNTISAQQLSVLKRNRYATVTFALIVFVLNATTLPSLIFVIVFVNIKVSVSNETTEILSRLMCLNSLLNPFVYSFRSTEFSIAVWKDMKAKLSRMRCSYNAPTSHRIEIIGL